MGNYHIYSIRGGGNHLLLHFYMVYIYKYVKKKVETSPGYKANIQIDEWRDFVQGPMENWQSFVR